MVQGIYFELSCLWSALVYYNSVVYLQSQSIQNNPLQDFNVNQNVFFTLHLHHVDNGPTSCDLYCNNIGTAFTTLLLHTIR